MSIGLDRYLGDWDTKNEEYRLPVQLHVKKIMCSVMGVNAKFELYYRLSLINKTKTNPTP